MTNERPRIGIIGAGRTAMSLGPALSRAGYRVALVSSRNGASAARLAAATGAGTMAVNAERAVAADIVFLTVPDGAIASEARRWTWRDGQAVVHCSGALGLEALSRGAAFCVFVEDDAEARAIIRRNIEAFGLTGKTRIFRRDATDLGPAGARDVASLMFLDPPYGKGLADLALRSAIAGGWLAPGAVVVCEERGDVIVDVPAALGEIDRRSYGDTQVHFLRNGSSPR